LNRSLNGVEFYSLILERLGSRFEAIYESAIGISLNSWAAWECLEMFPSNTNMKTMGFMNDSSTRRLTFLSWFSLAAPLIAYGLCIVAFYHPDLWSWIPWREPMPFRAPLVTKHYGFLAALVIAILAIFGDIKFKRWRLIGLPVAGLILAYCLYILAPDPTAYPIL
jgi:hypothetical protein